MQVSLAVTSAVSFAPTPWYHTALDLTDRVFRYAMGCFGLVQNGSMIAYGVEEVAVGYLPSKFGSKSEKATQPLPLKKIEEIKTKQFGVHGIAYIASGIFETLGGLESYKLLNLGGIRPSLEIAGWSLFLFANLYNLEKNIRIFQEAKELGGTLGHRYQVSAILGMMNSLGYIFATLFTSIPGTQEIALTLALLAIFSGIIKFFYDFFQLNTDTEACQ